MKRRLALKSEYLSDLTTAELTAVAGGVTGGCLTGVYPTFDRPCPTDNIAIAALPTLNTPCPTTDCFTGTSAHTLAC